MRTIDFELRGDYITLDTLLKVTGLVHSGGAGKVLVAEGKVEVDGQQELRKTCKIRAGQVVAIAGARVRVQGSAGPDTASESLARTELAPNLKMKNPAASGTRGCSDV